MRRLNAVLVLLPAVFLAGCAASSDSTTENEGKTAASDKQPASENKRPRSEEKRPSEVQRVVMPDPITVPEGATFPLVLETAISSGTSSSGDVVVARLAQDVRVGEKVVVPAGTEVRGQVTAAVPSGKVKGLARLAFDFDTLVLKGKEHSIGTRAVDITAANTHKKDAGIIAIGAGAGAIVGGIVDGKKGAVVGTLIGGAAGTGGVLATKGKEVEMGAGALVTVTLTREVRL